MGLTVSATPRMLDVVDERGGRWLDRFFARLAHELTDAETHVLRVATDPPADDDAFATALLNAPTLAVELARRGTGIRVNALVPGFFLGDQNRALLLDDEGRHTERGRRIVERTPLGRFGEPDELVSAAVWLTSPGARFVTGAVIPVDGGFSAFAGV